MHGLSVGEISRRCGVAVSTIHFYERKGLISALRTGGNQRRFDRAMIRRIALVKAAQQIGIPLADVARHLQALPPDRAPGQEDWQRIASAWSIELDSRIRQLTALRNNLSGCIGCGCLSMTRCAIINPGDQLGQAGIGPVVLQAAADGSEREV